MHGDLVLVVVILVVGFAAFFFGVIYAICRFLGFVGQCVWSLCTRRPLPRFRVPACSNPQCRNVEQRRARYCSKCGTKLM